MITAIIGHGTTPKGRRWSSFIDACDVVVRMWDWHWQDAADYGSKYDYGVLEVHPKLIRRFNEFNRHTPTKGWVGSELRRYVNGSRVVQLNKKTIGPLHVRYPRVVLPANTEVIDFRQLTAAYSGIIGGCGETGRWQLTRGTLAACWAIQRSKAGGKVVLVGCDNTYGGITLPVDDAFPTAYQQDVSAPAFRNYVAGVEKSGNHDFPAELRLINHLADECMVDVKFAQDVW